MASEVFNQGKGRVAAYADNVNNNTPANSAFVFVLLQANQADEDLRDYDNLSLLLANAGNTEATFTNYARIVLDDTAGITVTVDDANDRVVVDAPDQSITAAGGTTDNTLTKILLCYDADTTAGDDTNIIPLCHYDFAVTTTGADLPIRPTADGLYRAS